MAESLSAAGYATALYGKWHLGSHDGRLPNDQGFDEWYGIPRTTDEALWPGSPGVATTSTSSTEVASDYGWGEMLALGDAANQRENTGTKPSSQ